MEEMHLKLLCKDCENIGCNLNNYPSENGREGCIREVTDEEYDRYYYYITEALPFLYVHTSKEYQNRIYNDFLNLCDEIYQRPFIRKPNRQYHVY